MKLYILVGQKQRRYEILEVASFSEAREAVQSWDEAYAQWKKDGRPDNPFPPELPLWGGANVYLEDDEGKTWMHTFYHWQEISRRINA